MQTASSIEGQLEELHSLLEQHGNLPIILIGHSWGAYLSCLFTARYPMLVRKLILVGCPPFEEHYASAIMENRLNRLDVNKRKQFYRLIETLNTSEGKDKNIALARLGKFIDEIDTFEPVPTDEDEEELDCQANIFQNILNEVKELRKNNRLLELARQIQCPVLAIHGTYDPHPAEGVEKPLSSLIKNFRFVLLENCGHKPWIERQARDRFFEILIEYITRVDKK